MKSIYKMDIYPHLYNDLIKWSEKDITIRELRKLIQNRRVYLSIDVDGIAGNPSTHSLAEPTRRNQISKTTFKTILRNCRKYAKDIKFDISKFDVVDIILTLGWLYLVANITIFVRLLAQYIPVEKYLHSSSR